MRYFAATLLLVGFMSLGCNRPAANNPPTSPTNTAVNARDKNDPAGREPITGQDENPADIKTSADIRRRVLAEENIGTNGDNVKIMTSKGHVLLRGAVDNVAEKDKIVAIAKDVAGAANVTVEIDVVNAPVNPTPTAPDPKDAPKVLPPVTPEPKTINPPVPAPAPGTEPLKPETKS